MKQIESSLSRVLSVSKVLNEQSPHWADYVVSQAHLVIQTVRWQSDIWRAHLWWWLVCVVEMLLYVLARRGLCEVMMMVAIVMMMVMTCRWWVQLTVNFRVTTRSEVNLTHQSQPQLMLKTQKRQSKYFTVQYNTVEVVKAPSKIRWAQQRDRDADYS